MVASTTTTVRSVIDVNLPRIPLEFMAELSVESKSISLPITAFVSLPMIGGGRASSGLTREKSAILPSIAPLGLLPSEITPGPRGCRLSDAAPGRPSNLYGLSAWRSWLFYVRRNQKDGWCLNLN